MIPDQVSPVDVPHCLACGKALAAGDRRRGRQPQYCDTNCRSAAYRRRRKAPAAVPAPALTAPLPAPGSGSSPAPTAVGPAPALLPSLPQTAPTGTVAEQLVRLAVASTT